LFADGEIRGFFHHPAVCYFFFFAAFFAFFFAGNFVPPFLRAADVLLPTSPCPGWGPFGTAR